MKHNYEEHKKSRIDNARRQAEKQRQISEQRHNAAHQIASCISPGQPILVDHYSRNRHRRDLEKINNNMRASIEADKKAEYYDQKAVTIEQNTAISSDDPNALEKLRAELAGCEARQAFMKETNQCIRSQDKARFLRMEGTSEELWEKVNSPNVVGHKGFAHSKLTNNNANIRRLKDRIADLEKAAAIPFAEVVYKGITLRQNPQIGRIQIIFPTRTDLAVHKQLRKLGFVFCRSENAYQRQLNHRSIRAAMDFARAY
ncbi:DUF3560 domain-containing protein [Chitinophaga lutea]|uniref:DUF3560 domain-containing protein n=1 Tax=Chitinophaga lutea TaxID=2488634 RepID=A0A3N4Q6N2_9BACT|nr:DUF3560 domain-containing protein [Chitinophaga lutea]RPE13191.1 DUF3560 domain-containing protein [Chitinophaga lutea]